MDNNPDLSDRHTHAVINSALWAAAGDALGWITELSRGSDGVKYRTGIEVINEPIAWKRLIGGRVGVKVNLPAGTYSDDTQLRLAVSRAIRGNGVFDVEAFAKIELTVWPSFALGGGLGTKSAALNLSKRGINWFSNFFEAGDQKYVDAGGNGAAMRIQPHVWSSSGDLKKLAKNVLRNALVTHGHPHGFCGAVFHALSLADTLRLNAIPEPESWINYIDRFSDLYSLISEDAQLSAFWRLAWETNARRSLDVALKNTRDEALDDLYNIKDLLSGDSTGYHEILLRLNCLQPRFRGSGFKTALASLALSYLFRNKKTEEALITAANELDSDTDTIASMSGALLGVVSGRAPGWQIQDRDYITQEARRMSAIALKQSQNSFTYPDINRWTPPSKQIAAIGRLNKGLAIMGLGALVPIGHEYVSGEAVWQWFSLPFGQTILAKRRLNVKQIIGPEQLPGLQQDANTEMGLSQKSDQSDILAQSRLPLENRANDILSSSPRPQEGATKPLDQITDEVIQSDFNDQILGRLLNYCIDNSHSIETSIAFVSIIAKAKIMRHRRRKPT